MTDLRRIKARRPETVMVPAISRNASLLAASLLVVLTAMPVLLLRLPPMVDVLGHIGRYELQTGLAQQPWLQQFYTFRWQVIGNLGADLLVEVGEPWLGVMGAARLAVVLAPLVAASAILLLSRMLHGRITPFAICALALIYGLPFNWGFLNFSLAMALALLAFSLWLHLGPGARRAWVFLPLGLAIWLCHTFGWAFLCLLGGAESLSRSHREGRPWLQHPLALARDGWPLLAPLVPMLAWRSSAAEAGVDHWFDFAQKATWLIGIQRLSWERTDKACAALLFTIVYYGLRSHRVQAEPRMALAAGVAAGVFVLLPGQIFGSVFADMRLAPYVVILALLALRDTASPRGRMVAMVLACGFLAFRLALTGHVYAEREAELERQLAALDAIPEHARIATLVEIPCQEEWALPWFSHIGSVAIVRRHAFTNDQWANASMNPLQVRFSAAGVYAVDDAQLFFPRRCGSSPTLAASITEIPVRAFTHVWVVGVAPREIPARGDLQLVWSSADAAVFAVRSPLVLPPRRISKLSKLQP